MKRRDVVFYGCALVLGGGGPLYVHLISYAFGWETWGFLAFTVQATAAGIAAGMYLERNVFTESEG